MYYIIPVFARYHWTIKVLVERVLLSREVIERVISFLYRGTSHYDGTIMEECSPQILNH